MAGGATGHVPLVKDAVGIRTYGDEKVAAVITAIRILQSDEENHYNLMKKIFKNQFIIMYIKKKVIKSYEHKLSKTF